MALKAVKSILGDYMQTNERTLISRNKREGHYWRNMHGNHMRCGNFQVKPLKMTWDKWYDKIN